MEEGIYNDPENMHSRPSFPVNASNVTGLEQGVYEVSLSSQIPHSEANSNVTKGVDCAVYGENEVQPKKWRVRKKKSKPVAVDNPLYGQTIEIQTPNPAAPHNLAVVPQIAVSNVDDGGPSHPDENEYLLASNVYDCAISNEQDEAFSDSSSTSYEEVVGNGDDEHIYESLDHYAVNEPNQIASAPNNISEQRLSKRHHVIKELVQTEEDFFQNVHIMIEDIMKPLKEKELPLDVKMETLFGNIEKVHNFSRDFLSSLKAVSECSTYATEQDVNLGKVFIDNIPAMKEVYKMYCRNHDDAVALLEKYEEDPAFQVPVNDCLNKLKDKINVFDLGSFLIKPVQRVLKYPLLLRELLKLTDIPQPGQPREVYVELMQAVKLMQDVANDINEDKRKKDLVRKYRKPNKETDTLSERMSRLSLHAVRKKSARLSLRIGHAARLNHAEAVDETLLILVQRFKGLQKTIRNFLQNCESYTNQCREVLEVERVLVEHYNDFAGSDQIPILQTYAGAVRRIVEQLYRQLHLQTVSRIHTPLTTLLERFKGPQAIMDKRFDKLLDYENCQKNSDSKEKIQMAKHVYEALHMQLLEELPKFCDFSRALLETCVALFVTLQIQFQKKTLEEISPIFETFKNKLVGDEKGLTKTWILDQFNKDHNQVLMESHHLTIFPSHLRATTPEAQTRPGIERSRKLSQTSVVMQTPVQQQELLSKYMTEDVYVATSSYSSPDKMDISCSTNDLIAVIKRQDPLGNINKWFCDNGVTKGFLPFCVLKSYTPTQLRTPSPRPRSRGISPLSSCSSENIDASRSTLASLSPSAYSLRQGLYGNVGASDLDEFSAYAEIGDDAFREAFDEEDEMLDDTEYGAISSPGSATIQKKQFRVEFTFTARSNLELSIKEGEVISLIVSHDLEGNSDWWLMANSRGEQGYAPANYLSKV